MEIVMLSIFCAPARYVQGRNATDHLGKEMEKLGLSGNILILAGRSARRLLEQSWQERLPPHGYKPIIETFGGECSTAEIGRITAIAERHDVSVVVGAGGGKVLDTSR